MTRPNGISTNYQYDSLSRLLSVLHQAGASTIDGAVYTVDAAGNRTSKADQLAAVTSNYGYDAIYQLLQTTQGANTTESYSYDAVGNRLSSLGVSSYTVNSSNEVTAAAGVMYTYDSNGNTVSKTDTGGATSYAWDYENRLTSVTLPGTGGVVSFKYDPFGRRIEKISPSATSIFAYDDNNLVETVNSTGGVVARYTQGQNIDEPLAMLRGTTTSFYEQDGLGSVTSLSNTSGTLAQTYAYDSFGNQTASSGSLTNPFQYTARELDPETGLYYYRARYYDPAAGRFLSEDPSAFLAGNNFYPYVGNDPVLWDDPSGLQKCKKCGIKKGPEYDVSGTVPGGTTTLHFNAEFLNDEDHSPSCCEVRQLISWTQGGPPRHAGFDPSNAPAGTGGFQPGQWYEDRSAQNCRYGRRNAPYNSCVGPGNNYNGNGYSGQDTPQLYHHVLLGFRLIVVDICDGGKTIYTSDTVHVQF